MDSESEDCLVIEVEVDALIVEFPHTGAIVDSGTKFIISGVKIRTLWEDIRTLWEDIRTLWEDTRELFM